MSDRLSLTAEPRSIVGKKVKRLRYDGWIPAIVYGQGEPKKIQLENGPLRRVLRAAGTSDLFEIQVGSESYTVLVREIQSHVTRGDLLHIDFLEVDMKQSVTATADLVTINESPLTREHLGVCVQELRSVDIECLPNDLVSEIEVDLSHIQKVSDQIVVGDLAIPQGVTLLTDPDILVIRFQLAREEEEEEEEEEMISFGVEPEVIDKGKQEEEDF